MTVHLIDLNKNFLFERYKAKYALPLSAPLKGHTAIEITDFDGETFLPPSAEDRFNKFIYRRDRGLLIYIDTRRLKEFLDSLYPELNALISDSLRNRDSYDTEIFKFGGLEIPPGRIVIMGILNVTPDSFSDGGIYFETQKAVERGIELSEQGAEIIDIGGESSRPYSNRITPDEELDRIMPVVEGILKAKPDSILSVDTMKSEVAESVLNKGARIINDISGLTYDDRMASVVARYNASIVIMHMQGTPENMQMDPSYGDVVSDIVDFLYRRTRKALGEGISGISVDPGIGFGKKVFHNFEIINRINELKILGFPILIGLSRKSFLGKALNLELNERDRVSILAETLTSISGAKILRTHNVTNLRESLALTKYYFNPELLINV